MLDFIRRLFGRITRLWSGAASAPAPVIEEPVKDNRAVRRSKSSQRRHYERQRRKFDKFVEPQGPQPRKRQPAVRKTAKPRSDTVVVDDGDDFICVDKHYSDRETKVLYEQREFMGEFNFRDSILDQLERYFVYLDRMRKNDAGAYGFYRNVGATLMPYIAMPDHWVDHKDKGGALDVKLTPWFLETRPTFGCIAYGANPEAERIEREKVEIKNGVKMRVWIPRFFYFVKYEHPPHELQPTTGGDVYKMTVWWDMADDKKMKHGRPNDYGVFIGNDGSIRILKQLDTKLVSIRSGRNGLKKFDIPQRAWRIPHNYEEWAKLHGTNAQNMLAGLFCIAAQDVERAAWSVIRVSVEKDGRHAMFGVDIHRTPYFFRDRDIELTDSGLRKPIFHMVRPQLRADGTTVKLHFRGQREFTWAGYTVKITVPGRDYRMLEELDIGVIDSEWMEPKRDYVDETKIGAKLRQMMDGRGK